MNNFGDVRILNCSFHGVLGTSFSKQVMQNIDSHGNANE